MNTNMYTYPPQEIKLSRLMSLHDLVSKCLENGIEIERAFFFAGGFQLTFKNMLGDVILHDGSYGQGKGLFETCGFPWDKDTVSIHDADTLVRLLSALKNREDWKQYSEERA